MSLIVIHNPKKMTTAGFPQYDPELLTKINWKVFLTPVILTLVLAFGLSAFETLFHYIHPIKLVIRLKIFRLLSQEAVFWRLIPSVFL